MSHPAPPPRRSGGPGRALLLGAVVLLLAGCGERGCGPVVATYHLSSVDSLRMPSQTFRLRSSKRRTEVRPPKAVAMPPIRPVDKVHPLVRLRTAQMDSATVDSFMVTFVDTIGPSVRALGLSKQDLRAELTSRRASVYDTLAARLTTRYGAVRISDFLLIHAIFLRMPIGLVDSLAQDPDVVRIEPMLGGPPPQTWACGSDSKNLEYARDQLGANAYLEAGYGGGAVALLDTGVNSEHKLLKDSGRVQAFYQCDQDKCVRVSEGQIDIKPAGHGTASAAILIGQSDDMPKDEGMTRAVLHSYQVYDVNDTGGVEVNIPAAGHAFDEAGLSEVSLITAVVATTTGGPGALSMQATEAFENGQAVVTANGNANSTMHSPNDASAALGVGAYCLESNQFVIEFGDGLTADGRWKPDLTGPTAVWTAANGGPEAMGNYDGTSGATPFVSAAALLLRERMMSGGISVLPGHVYAALLLSADSDIARVEEGAGRVRLPDRGALYWGKLDVAEHESWKIPIEIVASGAATIEALIWWPRSGPEPYTPPTEEWRSDIDLRLLDASGNEKMRSDSAGEVRERVFDEVPAGSSGKWWSIDIYGYSVPGTEKQPVYWAVWVRDAE